MSGDALSCVFFGTSAFAVPALEALAGAGFRVLMAVTQPDRPRGRGMKVAPCAVKVAAERLGIPVFQPARVRDPEALARIAAAGADCLVLVAYGQLLPGALFSRFRLGAVNIHPSLLPGLRGAAPIQRAILAGDAVTGLSIMLMDAGMDTGPVLAQEAVPIAPFEPFGSLHDRLSEGGARLLLATLPLWARDEIAPVPQDWARASLAPPVAKDELRLRWERPAHEVANAVRAFDPAPGAWFLLGEARVKAYAAGPCAVAHVSGRPGEVLGASGEGLCVVCGDGRAVALGALKAEGRSRVSAAQFLRGRAVAPGTVLG